MAAVADVNVRHLLRRVNLAGVAAVLGVLAAAGALADLHAGSRATRAVLAVDRSASVDARMRDVQARWIEQADPDGCVQPCRIVGFAARAHSLAAHGRGAARLARPTSKVPSKLPSPLLRAAVASSCSATANRPPGTRRAQRRQPAPAT